jgi:NADH dehydrogenase
MARIFLTGGGGFVGRVVTRALVERGHEVAALVRTSLVREATRSIPGDLLDPSGYRAVLTSSDVVVHLAAATGRALPSEHHRINVEGTRVLVDACRAAGVKRLLFMSSVAAGFPPSRYPYARAKAEAEQLVAHSGIPFWIVRPTIVVGPGAPVMAALGRLASLPVLPVFGRGDVRVQPVWVGDVADVLADLLAQPDYLGDTIGVGGPASPTIKAFLVAVRCSRGRPAGPVVHLPLGAVIPVLTALETFAYRLLPVTVGQLASFRFDGTVAPHPLVDARRPRMKDVAAMLAASA